MRRQPYWILLFIGALWARGEIVDRVAVTVDKMVITESEIVNQMRIAAFLNAETFDPSPAAKREAATRLVEQVLIRREMEISRYATPKLSETEPIVDRIRQDRFPGGDGYSQALGQYGIREQELRENLLQQLTILRFVEYRFRPGIAVTDEEVSDYYERRLLPDWRRRSSEAPPDLEDAREQIEEILIGERVNQALDQWLRQAAQQARIQYREVVFQ